MSNQQTSKTKALLNWVDARFPLTKLWNDHVGQYYAPKNFNFWYYFGSLALLVLVIQIVSGIFLTMNFKPDGTTNAYNLPVAFTAVEYIMRDVSGGWIIRYMHSTGASFFFIVVYLHMFRGLIYGSYKKPRELVWIFGSLIFLALMAEAFMGYLLPWGQMSFWGAQVIINLFSAIPVIGPDLSTWIRGDFNVSDATLNRFFALHVIAVPLVLLGLVVAHLIALHEVGSNNPDGVEIKKLKDENGIPLDGIPFHPYYTVKDILGVAVFLIVFCSVLFFAPEGGGYFLEAPNFDPANPMVTPAHIAFIGLGILGAQVATDTRTLLARIFSIFYFAFFLGMPFYTKLDKNKPVPERVTMSTTKQKIMFFVYVGITLVCAYLFVTNV